MVVPLTFGESNGSVDGVDDFDGIAYIFKSLFFKLFFKCF